MKQSNPTTTVFTWRQRREASLSDGRELTTRYWDCIVLYRFHVEYLIGSGRDQKHSTFHSKGMFECSTFQDVEPKERNLHETVTNSKYGSLALAQGHLNDPTCRLLKSCYIITLIHLQNYKLSCLLKRKDPQTEHRLMCCRLSWLYWLHLVELWAQGTSVVFEDFAQKSVVKTVKIRIDRQLTYVPYCSIMFARYCAVHLPLS